jgi:hypothetical protein
MTRDHAKHAYVGKPGKFLQPGEVYSPSVEGEGVRAEVVIAKPRTGLERFKSKFQLNSRTGCYEAIQDDY